MGDYKQILDEHGQIIGYTIDRGYGLEETINTNGKTIGYTQDNEKMLAQIESEQNANRGSSDYLTIEKAGIVSWLLHFVSYWSAILLPIYFLFVAGFDIMKAINSALFGWIVFYFIAPMFHKTKPRFRLLGILWLIVAVLLTIVVVAIYLYNGWDLKYILLEFEQ